MVRQFFKISTYASPAGTSLAIVGPTGSGKSTLVGLIPRLHDAPPGEVFIDGQPIRNFTLAGVTSEYRLRSARDIPLLRHHPTGTSPSAVPKRRRSRFRTRPASRTSATRSLSFPKVSTPWSANAELRSLAAKSSAPQSHAQSFASPRILILDDALASVDTYTEERILNGLRQGMGSRTTVFISHRISTAPQRGPNRSVSCGPHRRARHPRRADHFRQRILHQPLREAASRRRASR